MIPPSPKLQPGIIYSSDNGRLICRQCAGMSALYTGRDISGQRVTSIPRSQNAGWRQQFGKDMTCEGGCTTYSAPSAITSESSTTTDMTPPSPEVDTHHAVVQRIRDTQPVIVAPAPAPPTHTTDAVFSDF